MTTIGHVFICLDRAHDGTVPTNDDQSRFESLPVPLALWELFQQCLSKHLSELTEGQIDREETFSFEAAHVNAMIAVVEAEAVAAAPELRNWLTALAAAPNARQCPLSKGVPRSPAPRASVPDRLSFARAQRGEPRNPDISDE
jgi:hypothetical protein